MVEIKRVLSPHLGLLIDAALKISVQRDYSLNLREITLLFLELVAENYSKQLVKKVGVNMVEKIIQTGLIIASENEADYEGEHENRNFTISFSQFI